MSVIVIFLVGIFLAIMSIAYMIVITGKRQADRAEYKKVLHKYYKEASDARSKKTGYVLHDVGAVYKFER